MEVKQRVANILRFFSMVLVVIGLLFMYAYGSDAHSASPAMTNWATSFSKSFIFYLGLTIFGVINILFTWWIKSYRDTNTFDGWSFLFKSEAQKSWLLIWFTLQLAVFNFLLASVIAFIGFVRIEGVAAESKFFFIPVIGLALFILVLVGGAFLILNSFRKP